MDTPNQPIEPTGHPAEGATASSNSAEAALTAASAAPAAAPSFTPVYVGGRKFESAEDLASYTAELHDVAYRAPAAAPAPVIDADPDRELAELMFQDPRTAIKVLKQEAKQEFKRELDQDNASRDAWTKFYETHPDLKGLEDMVGTQANKMAQRIAKLPLEQAMKELGTAVRGRLATIRGTPTTGEPLPKGPAVTAGSSGGQGPKVEVPRQSMSFVEQMQKLRSRGKTN